MKSDSLPQGWGSHTLLCVHLAQAGREGTALMWALRAPDSPLSGCLPRPYRESQGTPAPVLERAVAAESLHQPGTGVLGGWGWRKGRRPSGGQEAELGWRVVGAGGGAPPCTCTGGMHLERQKNQSLFLQCFFLHARFWFSMLIIFCLWTPGTLLIEAGHRENTTNKGVINMQIRDSPPSEKAMVTMKCLWRSEYPFKKT